MDARLEPVVRDLADELGVPGVAAGILHGDEQAVAVHGITSVEHPLPVDEHTLFQFGSTGKTYTAVAILRLVEAGTVDLDAPVKRYVPELRLRDRAAEETVTVLQLLNHTAGWDGDDFTDTGDGDDAIAGYVAHMAELAQVTPPGAVVAYNNASLTLAGRVIENVTGTTYERAMADLVLGPAGLAETYFFPNDVMTRRFAVGHRREPDGTVRVLRPWAMPRSGNPMGGMAASVLDQLRWARLHLDGGRTPEGAQLLDAGLIARMQRPTVASPGSDLGDAVGISWFLSDYGGETMVEHGGATVGQLAGFAMVPSRRFALVSLTNAEPVGSTFNRRLRDWAFATYLGLARTDPVAEPRPAADLAAFAGTYATVANVFTVAVDGGGLRLVVEPTPALVAQLGEDADDREEMRLGLLSGGDRYVVPSGPHAGERGYFVRDASGGVAGLHVHGRYAPRTG